MKLDIEFPSLTKKAFEKLLVGETFLYLVEGVESPTPGALWVKEGGAYALRLEDGYIGAFSPSTYVTPVELTSVSVKVR